MIQKPSSHIQTLSPTRQLLQNGGSTLLVHQQRVKLSRETLAVPKFRCLPSATFVSWKLLLGSWLMRRVSSWQAMLFPGTMK